MRALLTRAVIASLAITSLIVGGQGSAAADMVCQQTDPATGQCLIWVEVPGTPGTPGDPGGGGPKGTGPGASCYWDPAKQGLSQPPAGPVPCTSEFGYWSNTYNCYIKAMDPQPPADDPAWQGHDPGDGAVYTCYQPQTGIIINLWAQDPPPNSGIGPTPQQVAQIAIDSMRLSAINIGIAPEPGPNSIGLVGMPVWMWANNPDNHTYGPATASASAGGIRVTATARVEQITWDMGDGSEVVCRTPGTPYKPSFGNRRSPDCGHIYDKSSAHEPGGQYVVTATSDWVITWSGAGQTGTIRLNGLSRSVAITVGEAQVLVE
ncbi:hypothetical protein FB382_001520 [Nocardioides ginsengisegetis]|uniref:ATP/GTP-binding protein n=1 Tax=Nocardioides ginsengisegetis TaxID=661491 RepID=A0A7W3IZA0_9ACTN|nr:hypothetical protein [Nocardioides ginsengisegetis]MBA8803229.1 hypothetical protein [Nocardioides ginsengisegetis]